jgi:hypothetical protein
MSRPDFEINSDLTVYEAIHGTANADTSALFMTANPQPGHHSAPESLGFSRGEHVNNLRTQASPFGAMHEQPVLHRRKIACRLARCPLLAERSF